jgi:hypothetical protein
MTGLHTILQHTISACVVLAFLQRIHRDRGTEDCVSGPFRSPPPGRPSLAQVNATNDGALANKTCEPRRLADSSARRGEADENRRARRCRDEANAGCPRRSPLPLVTAAPIGVAKGKAKWPL